ncbi:hypothetical protein HIM_10340 [Hirsutella minnesotensis 3608]|uniref:Uncharacterized protein n=1 Tax=Hirsutella minnesotensis 3608 TaxID=1043627 RepID=A0A0F8A2E2_9HYPO|nr:hypothetical protein HIM_10340 [Hirsutella minnesotensis 3608]
MKREHVTLPTLQFAAAAFFATVCQAAALDASTTLCVDGADKIIEASNCDGTGPAGSFFLARGPFPEDAGTGTTLTKQPIAKVDSSDHNARVAAGFPENGAIARRGFGKRNPQDDEDSSRGG